MRDLPVGIAPHNKRELKLMLTGEKRIAMLECVYDEFEPYLKQGQLKHIADDEYTHIIYAFEYEQDDLPSFRRTV